MWTIKLSGSAIEVDEALSACRPVERGDDASPVTPGYVAPFRFSGGRIDKVVVDVSGEPYADHEVQVRRWFLLD